MAYFIGFAAVSGAFGGLIAFGIQNVQSSVADWRLLFIVEVSDLSLTDFMTTNGHNQGIPAVLLGVVAVFYLPDRPGSAKFLNDDEKKLAIERMNRTTTGDSGMHVNKCMSSLVPQLKKRLCLLQHMWCPP